MRWLGGFCGPRRALSRVPVGAALVASDAPACWRVGRWNGAELRWRRSERGFVAIVGCCGVSDGEFGGLVEHGVPDDVAWRWSGSYVVVEIETARTRIWTDLGSAWPIYTTSMDGGVYWGSSSRALAALSGTRPDLDRLSAWLLAPAVPALLVGRSSFAGVEWVPPGHRLTLSADGTRTTARVWSAGACGDSPADRMRTELSAAVALRVRSAAALTADLSGGYDSTSLAMLAAEVLAPNRSIVGVTVHPDGYTSGGDLTYARAAASARPGLVHRLLPLGMEHAPYSSLADVPVTDEPAPSTIAYARFTGQLRWMRDTFGTDCHLTGDGGDSLLLSPPIMLADLIATGQYRRALVETTRWARFRRLSSRRLIAAAIRTARSTRPEALAALAVHLSDNRRTVSAGGDIHWCATDPVPAWATDQARERAASLASATAKRAETVDAGLFSSVVLAEAMAEVGRSARADIQLAEDVGVPLHNPFTDSRVIDASLSVPLDHRAGPAAYKPVLREAMANLFPDVLATRTSKGDFNPDHYGGMRTNLAALHSLADGRLAGFRLVQPAALRSTLAMTAAGLPVAVSTVEPAVAAEVWLQVLDRTPPVVWSAPQRETVAP